MKLDIAREVGALQKMSTGQLCERYAELFGEPTRTRHKAYLIRKIAWGLQARAEGDLSERARRRAAELADGAELRVMPPRPVTSPPAGGIVVQAAVSTDSRLPPPGTALVRPYKGRTIHVQVLAHGFDFEGQRYKSLSAVAKAVTGSHCNGFRFFGLEGGK